MKKAGRQAPQEDTSVHKIFIERCNTHLLKKSLHSSPCKNFFICFSSMEVPCSKDVSLHGAMLNAVTHFLHRKEFPKASEILRDYISIFIYILHIMSLQKISTSERVKTFKWHEMATQVRPNANILVLCIFNDLSICQL